MCVYLSCIPLECFSTELTLVQIEPSEELTWVPCFDNPKVSCANLLVPLDYADESAGMTNIAWVKYISVDESAEDIIFNPGECSILSRTAITDSKRRPRTIWSQPCGSRSRTTSG